MASEKTKVCRTCKDHLPLSKFGVQKCNPDGRRSQCKLCGRDQSRQLKIDRVADQVRREELQAEIAKREKYPQRRSNWRRERALKLAELRNLGYRSASRGSRVPRILQDHTLINDAAECLYDGLTQEQTCKALCMAKGTWREYRRKGREVLDQLEGAMTAGEKTPKFDEWDIACATFVAATEEAVARFSRRNMQTIRAHGEADSRNWQALAWLQERRFPDDFGRKERVTHEHKGGLTVSQLIEISMKQKPLAKAAVDSLHMGCDRVEVESGSRAALPPAKTGDVIEAEVVEAEVLKSSAWGDGNSGEPTEDHP